MNCISFHVLSNIKNEATRFTTRTTASLPLTSGHLFIANEVLNSIVLSATNQTSHCLKIPNEGEAFRKVYFFSGPTLNISTEAYVTENVLTAES